jgi:hypothetical protein
MPLEEIPFFEVVNHLADPGFCFTELAGLDLPDPPHLQPLALAWGLTLRAQGHVPLALALAHQWEKRREQPLDQPPSLTPLVPLTGLLSGFAHPSSLPVSSLPVLPDWMGLSVVQHHSQHLAHLWAGSL